jgi:quercetin dioxygenase-like cupin family protein
LRLQGGAEVRKALVQVFALAVVCVVGSIGNRTAWSQYSGAAGAVGASSTVVLQSSKTAIGQDIRYPVVKPEVTALLVEIAPGGQTGRHQHPVTEFAYVLNGTLTVAVEGQGEKVFTAGQGFIEAMNTWHNGMNRGTTPVKILAVFVGEQGKPNVVRP